MSKICHKCNTLNDNSNRFCINCGEPLLYNNIPQNQPQYLQDFNQYQNTSETNNQNSPAVITIAIVIILVIIIIAIASISAFVLYLV